MYNSVILVGHTVSDVSVVTLDSGLKVATLVLACQRPFVNQDNQYDTDFISVKLFEGLASAVSEHCKKGSTVLVKARLAVRKIEVKEVKMNSIDVIGERVLFLNLKNSTSQKPEEEFVEG